MIFIASCHSQLPACDDHTILYVYGVQYLKLPSKASQSSLMLSADVAGKRRLLRYSIEQQQLASSPRHLPITAAVRRLGTIPSTSDILRHTDLWTGRLRYVNALQMLQIIQTSCYARTA